jgi:hypothetical protein
MRNGATNILRWFSAVYVVAILVQVFLAGEGIFRIGVIKNSDDCDKTGAHCIANSRTLDAHRGLGTILVLASILFLVVALVAWNRDRRVRVVSIVAPVVTFLQIVFAGIGSWAGGLHAVDAFIVLVLYAWLFLRLRPERGPASAA